MRQKTKGATQASPSAKSLPEPDLFPGVNFEKGYRAVDVLKEVARQHNESASSVALAWLLGQKAISSVIIAARKTEHLEDNIRATDLRLSEEELRQLDAVSDPGTPYPKWMVLQLDTAEDPRLKVLHPERYADGKTWKDLRGIRWSE